MARQPKLSEVKFPVTLVDGKNSDGEDRQELLYTLAGNNPSDNILQYHRSQELRENGHQVIEIMVNDRKIGELDDSDYVLYEKHIHNARGGRVSIYQEEDEEGNIHCTCDSFLIVPYINSEEERKKLRKRKQISIVFVCALFMFFGVKGIIEGTFSTFIMSLIASFVFIWYGFIRDPKKDDAGFQFVANGKKKTKLM